MTNGRGGLAHLISHPVPPPAAIDAGLGARDEAAAFAEAKAALRREARRRRVAACAQGGPAAAAAVAGHVLDALTAWHPGDGAVAGYAAIRDELDPAPLLAALHGQGRTLALPAGAGRGVPLQFRAWTPGEPLVPGGFGVPEPLPAAPCVVPRVVVVPLLAFDRAGRRLGYGAGCYDRTLAALRRAGPVLAVGVGFAAQEVAEVPVDAYDQRLDGVVTEAGAWRIPGAAKDGS